jgi:hypothetical protein
MLKHLMNSLNITRSRHVEGDGLATRRLLLED